MIYIYIHIFINIYKHKHKFNIYIYIYIYICVCVRRRLCTFCCTWDVLAQGLFPGYMSNVVGSGSGQTPPANKRETLIPEPSDP